MIRLLLALLACMTLTSPALADASLAKRLKDGASDAQANAVITPFILSSIGPGFVQPFLFAAGLALIPVVVPITVAKDLLSKDDNPCAVIPLN